MGSVMMLLFIIVLVVVGVLLVLWPDGSGPQQPDTHHSPRGRDPLDILKERFTKGKIAKTNTRNGGEFSANEHSITRLKCGWTCLHFAEDVI
jgi:uncharacterized membrane protein